MIVTLDTQNRNYMMTWVVLFISQVFSPYTCLENANANENANHICLESTNHAKPQSKFVKLTSWASALCHLLWWINSVTLIHSLVNNLWSQVTIAGANSHMKEAGMRVVSLRGVNFWFWYLLAWSVSFRGLIQNFRVSPRGTSLSVMFMERSAWSFTYLSQASNSGFWNHTHNKNVTHILNSYILGDPEAVSRGGEMSFFARICFSPI